MMTIFAGNYLVSSMMVENIRGSGSVRKAAIIPGDGSGNRFEKHYTNYARSSFIY